MKHKQLLILTLLTLSGSGLKAQDAVTQKFSDLFRSHYDYYTGNVLTHPFLKVDDYALISAKYTIRSAGYNARQDGDKEKNVHFFTEGTRQVGKFKVSGVFSYSHTLRDSVAFSLGDHDLASPFYFFAGAKGNWEISKYNLNGIATRSLLNDKLILTGGGKFVAGNSWRSNDPRMENFSHDLSASLAAHYKIMDKHTIGIAGTLGGISRENSNEYRNKDYQDNLQNMKYINFINYGYGLNVIQNTSREIFTYTDRYAFGGIYNGSFDFGSITLAGNIENQYSSYVRKPGESASANYVYGKFDEQIRSVSLFWTATPKEKIHWNTLVSFVEDYGTDFNRVLGGHNYTYYKKNISLKPVAGFMKDGQIRSELSLNLSSDRLFRSDGTTSHKADYQNTTAGLGGSWFSKVSARGDFFKFSASYAHRFNNKTIARAPKSQENTFTREVMYYDYYFNGASTNTINLKALYNLRIKKTGFFIGINYEMLKAILPDSDFTITEMPGNSRNILQLNAGFTL